MIENNEEKYPSVPLAYDIALKSYDWLFRRAEVMDDRLEKLIAWTTGINLAFITVISRTSDTPHHYGSPWLCLAVLSFLVAVVLAMIARLGGSLRVVSPNNLLGGWLHFSHWEFKKNAIFKASEDYSHNKQLVNRKGRIAIISTVLFLVEATLLSVWVIRP